MNLWAEVVTAIETSPKIDGRFLLAIETLMISSLKSKQKAVINESIQLWNQTFGTAKSLEYPASLLPVLVKLRTLTDISLPTFPKGIDIDVSTLRSLQNPGIFTHTQKVSCSPLHFTETQLDEERLAGERKSTPPMLSTRPFGEIGSSEGKEDLDEDSSRHSTFLAREPSRQSPTEQTLETTPKITPKITSKITQNTTPKARVRHNDSQIQFAAIESSPLVPETVDSQSLTDHQKEVRERQGLERAAMFPDLRSTPKTRTREQDEAPLKLILKGTQGSHTKEELGDNLRIISHVDDTLDDIFGCSPTPRSSRRNPNQLSFSSETSPSSPGQPKLGAASNDLPPTLDKLQACAVEMEFEEMKVDIDLAPECHIMHNGEIIETSKNSHELLPQQPDTRSEASIDYDRAGVPLDNPIHDLLGTNPSLESKILIDGASDPIQNIQDDVQEQCIEAPANPNLSQEILYLSDGCASGKIIDEQITSTPGASANCPEKDSNDRIMTEGNKVIQIVDSFQEPRRSQPTSEDDQIAAQLVSDLERASSQAEAEMNGALPATEESVKAGGKRKNSFEDIPPTKKSKVLPQPQVVQVVIDSTGRGEADGECVRPKDNDRFYPPAGETKHDLSPSHRRSSRVSSRNSRTRKRPSCPARSSTASDSPRQEPWPVAEPVHHQCAKMESESDSQSEESIIAEPSQRGSIRINLPSIGNRYAQHGLPTTRYESDPGALLVDFPSSSGFDREEDGEGSGLEQMEGEALGDDSHTARVSQIPSEPTALAREMSTDRAGSDDQDNRSSIRLVKVHNSASQNDEMQTEKEHSASPSKTTEQVAIETQAPRHEFQGILAGFRRLLGEIRQVRLGAEEEREMIGVLFDCVGEVHEAGRRSTSK